MVIKKKSVAAIVETDTSAKDVLGAVRWWRELDVDAHVWDRGGEGDIEGLHDGRDEVLKGNSSMSRLYRHFSCLISSWISDLITSRWVSLQAMKKSMAGAGAVMTTVRGW